MLLIKPDELKITWREWNNGYGDLTYMLDVEPFGTVAKMIYEASLRNWQVWIGNQELTMLHKRAYPTVDDAKLEVIEILKQILQAIIESN